ncbi:MAG: fluoride efflux transporter CrcB [Proteiniphilum sp.]|nr:fluoride efflux transporter CrcB [Proteiniphilum sp.]
MLKDLLFVALGGGIGSALRYLTSRIVVKLVSGNLIFLGTFTANIIGSLLIGLLSGWMLINQPDNQTFRLLFIVGFCGGYTTFSTFAFENMRLIELNQWGLLTAYVLASVVLGVLAVWVGVRLAR